MGNTVYVDQLFILIAGNMNFTFLNNLKNLKRKYALLSVLTLILVLLVITRWCSGVKELSGIERMSNKSCIFCDIASGKVPDTKLEVETDEYVIFKDIKPASQYHYLAVPKKHYESLKVLNSSHAGMIKRMDEGLRNFFNSKDIDTNDAIFGFHLPPFITVNHLHMHGISPRSKISWIYKMAFAPSTAWFKTTLEALDYIKKNDH